MSTETPAAAPAPDQFLIERIAPRFTALVGDAERRLAALQKEVDDLRAAEGTLCWMIEGHEAAYVNLAGGAMSVSPTAAHDPFMTLHMTAEQWRRFASGEVQTGFLDDRGGRRPFGQSRISRLKALKGTVQFVVTALPDGDWACKVAFGGPPATEPNASVSLGADVVEQIQSGQLDPQMAFMQGRVKMTGDAGLVMQLGMAMFM